jgi:hypothetical protein
MLTPETPEESDLLRRCLGSENPMKIIGVLEWPDSSVTLWGDSQNVGECAPKQSGSDLGYVIVHKKADLGNFMNALRRYINVIIDNRLHADSSSEESERLSGKIHEASQDLQKVIKPIFEEEITE